MKVLNVCHSNLIYFDKLIIITFSGDLRHFMGLWNNYTTTQTIKVFHFNEDSCVQCWKTLERLKSERINKLIRKRESVVLHRQSKENKSNYFVISKILNRLLKNNVAIQKSKDI